MKTNNSSNPILIYILICVLFLILLLFYSFFSYLGTETPQFILLSFDVEPVDSPSSVLKLLDILDNNNITATFFITGKYIELHKKTAQAIHESGHEIACHSYSHPNFIFLTKAEKSLEIYRCKSLIKNLTSRPPTGFRAPYHLIDGSTLSLLENFGFIYDASFIDNFPFPSIKNKKLKQLPISSFAFLPLEDVIWLYYLNMDGVYFYLLKNKKGNVLSFNFHPHHIVSKSRQLDLFIKSRKAENTRFISHSSFVKLLKK